MADEPIIEIPQPTPEEQAEQEILVQPDAEQIIVQDLTLSGTPIKHITVRSRQLNKQVVRIQKYYQLEEDDGTIIGFQRWGDEAKIQIHGTKNDIALDVLGRRIREKVE